MATLRAIAHGDSKERRTSASRLAYKQASTEVGTRRTFVSCTMLADGSGGLMIQRGGVTVRLVFNPETEGLCLEHRPLSRL